MIRDVIVSDTTPALWLTQRQALRNRLVAALGHAAPSCSKPVLQREVRLDDGLRYTELQFPLTDEFSVCGLLVEPAQPSLPAQPVVLCIHGSDAGELGRHGVFNAEHLSQRAFGLELARRGSTVLALDQFGFGACCAAADRKAFFESFYEHYPQWSLDGIRLRAQQAGLDYLAQHVPAAAQGVRLIGHSIGARIGLLLMALDERIVRSVISAGLSPQISNVYRTLSDDPTKQHSPVQKAALAATGRPFFEHSETLAMCAPRPLLLLEPWNDPFNPYIETAHQCFEKARFVYALCDHPAAFSMLTHGHEHDTPQNLRTIAYDFLLA